MLQLVLKSIENQVSIPAWVKDDRYDEEEKESCLTVIGAYLFDKYEPAGTRSC